MATLTETSQINKGNDNKYTRVSDDTPSIQVENDDVGDNDVGETNNKPVITFRYKFTPSIMHIITNFAKQHQYDDRQTYKEAWSEWREENYGVIQKEEDRLNSLGYNKDINEKMYKAGRYYFRKKSSTPLEAKKRRIYTTLTTSILDCMDTHIVSSIEKEDFTPAAGYTEFCNDHQGIIIDEIKIFLKYGVLNAEDISSKIKKTYKNRYYIITRST